MAVTTDQETLKNFLKRRHPEYYTSLPHWTFVESTYQGGRDWFGANIFRYIKEGEKEFNDRLGRAYRFNHTRETVDLVQKYIFKSDVERSNDAPKEIGDFWNKATQSGLDIDQFMMLVSCMSAIFGRIWVFTDTNKTQQVVTAADEKEAQVGVYAYFVKPQNILDVGFARDGSIAWILVMETRRDDQDPFTATGNITLEYRLWTPDAWYLFDIIQAGKRGEVVRMLDSGINELGEVPCFPVDHVLGENRYTAPGLIDDSAYLDRAVANYLSNLDAIIQDQTFSQLAMPAQGMLPGEDKYNALLEMGTKRIFVYDGEGGAKPEYISPDPSQAQLIITVINKIIAEIYNTVGMAGERTKEDNAVGIDNSSGVAKAYDFERVNSLLANKADSLENAENRLVEMVMKWHGKAAPAEELVKYPDTFDVRSLFDEFTIAQNLSLVDAPKTVRREQMLQVVDKLFPRLAADLRKTIETELKSWPADPVDLAAAASSKPPTSFNASNKNPQTQNRQGQVTSETANKQVA